MGNWLIVTGQEGKTFQDSGEPNQWSVCRGSEDATVGSKARVLSICVENTTKTKPQGMGQLGLVSEHAECVLALLQVLMKLEVLINLAL